MKKAMVVLAVLAMAGIGFLVTACPQSTETPQAETAAAPTANPAAGTYNGAQSVTLGTATQGADIYYTLDGSEPSKTSGTKYTTPVGISTTKTLKAIAVKDGMNDSGVLTAAYTIKTIAVYIAGSEGAADLIIPVYWKNGVRNVLPKTGSIALTEDIAVSGNDVYIVGIDTDADDNNIPVYWKNGVQSVLPSTGVESTARGIAISGSDVYIVGSDGDDPVYWKNGTRNVLPKTAGLTSRARARARAIAISGNDVYIAGKDGDDAVYWKNGVKYTLPSTGTPGSMMAIAISGNDVYIAGFDNTPAQTPVYWKNGVRNILPITGDSGQTSGIAINGNDVYIAGYDYINSSYTPVYWKNGVRNVLPGGTVRGIDVAIVGSDVYIAGNSYNPQTPVYWKNGERNALPLSAGAASGQVSSIAIAWE